MSIVLDLGPFQEITKIQLNRFCYGTAVVGQVDLGSWIPPDPHPPMEEMFYEYGMCVTEKGWPDPWLEWLLAIEAAYMPRWPGDVFICRLRVDSWEEGAWVAFPERLQVGFNRRWGWGMGQTAKAGGLTAYLDELPFGGFHLFAPAIHLRPTPWNDQASYNPIQAARYRSFFHGQRVRIWPPPLKT
ncbi:MAG: hypothetical protein HQL95_05240 [Magnetococcales bacterium]|nr:hypothetical protein [Magnetococcales bacterium]